MDIDIYGENWTDNTHGGKTWEGDRFVCLTRGYGGGLGLTGLHLLDKTTGDIYSWCRDGGGQPMLDNGASQDGYQRLYGAAYRAVMGRQALGDPRFPGGPRFVRERYPNILRGMYFKGMEAA